MSSHLYVLILSLSLDPPISLGQFGVWTGLLNVLCLCVPLLTDWSLCVLQGQLSEGDLFGFPFGYVGLELAAQERVPDTRPSAL